MIEVYRVKGLGFMVLVCDQVGPFFKNMFESILVSPYFGKLLGVYVPLRISKLIQLCVPASTNKDGFG